MKYTIISMIVMDEDDVSFIKTQEMRNYFSDKMFSSKILFKSNTVQIKYF